MLKRSTITKTLLPSTIILLRGTCSGALGSVQQGRQKSSFPIFVKCSESPPFPSLTLHHFLMMELSCFRQTLPGFQFLKTVFL